MRLGWSSVRAAGQNTFPFLFFSYHNDARSNKRQINFIVVPMFIVVSKSQALHPIVFYYLQMLSPPSPIAMFYFILNISQHLYSHFF